MRCRLLLLALPLFLAPLLDAAPTPELERFTEWLLDDGERFAEVPFAELVTAVSGQMVLPVQPEEPVDQAMLDTVSRVLERCFAVFADPAHPIHQVGRVNEISRHFEDFLLAELNAVEGLRCGTPPTASGALQRSGYPDLRLRHEASGRVFYLDPKVYRAGTEGSSFRTFYFEPKRETNKIRDDASHLIIGIAHEGKQDGRWRLAGWTLVDLADFKVRLKAEFQASNRELYREAAVLRSSRDAPIADR